jgi:CHAD domain-containing protein
VQLSAVKALDPMVRSNEPDAVHQMRVATRRFRSTLQSFRRFFGESEIEPLMAELRWLGTVLGQARDAEVIGGHLEGHVASLPAELVIGPVAARIKGHFAHIGADAQAAAVKALDSPRYFALLDRLDELIAAAPETKAARRPAMEVLPPTLRQAYKTTSRRMKRALGEPEGTRGDVALHQARKAAKRARYAGEAVTPAFGTKASRFATNMKRMQLVLGAHQDAVIARQADRDLGISAHLAGENAFAYGLLYGLDDQEARQLRVRARRTWRSASRPKLRRWLS